MSVCEQYRARERERQRVCARVLEIVCMLVRVVESTEQICHFENQVCWANMQWEKYDEKKLLLCSSKRQKFYVTECLATGDKEPVDVITIYIYICICMYIYIHI